MENLETNIEETLAIIKPDAFVNSVQITEILLENGFTIKDLDIRTLDVETVRDHYSHLLDKPFYPKLEEFMTCGPVVVMILAAENAVQKLRELMGPTNSENAEKGTIRGDYGMDVTYNAIHGSDSVENAQIEINRFFPSMKRSLKKENE